MKQWITKQDGLKKLYQEDTPIPEPGENEVLVRINTVSLNYRDTEVCMGLYGHHASISQGSALVPCSDMCGTVVKKGIKTEGAWAEGTRVMAIFNQTHLNGQIKEKHMPSGLGLPLPGVLAEYRVFPTSGLIAVPEYLNDEEASTLPIAGVTAWMSINWMRSMNDHMTGSDVFVLLQGTGGVSISGLQIAKASGMKCIVTSSSDAKLDQARKLGADYVINYKKIQKWQEEVMKITNGQGVDIIFECGGAETLNKSFECIAFGGMIACIGYLSGKDDREGNRTNTNVLALKRNVTLKGILNGPKDRFQEMLNFYSQKQIHPVIDRIFDFDHADEALQYLYNGQHFGKVVIKV